MDRVDEELKPQVAQWAAHYDHRLKLGNKPIFHLEGVHNFIRVPSNQLSVSRSIRSEDHVHPKRLPRGLHGIVAAVYSIRICKRSAEVPCCCSCASRATFKRSRIKIVLGFRCEAYCPRQSIRVERLLIRAGRFPFEERF